MPYGPRTRKRFLMPTFSAPTGALLAFGHFELPFLGVNSRLKPQTLKLCIQTNIDILFLLVLSLIETKEFQLFKIGKNVHFSSKFVDCLCFCGKFGV